MTDYFATLFSSAIARISARGRFSTEARLIIESRLFLDAWYRVNFVKHAGIHVSMVTHYLESGCSEGLNPNPLFWSTWYLEHNPDVRQAGVNPLVHFIKHGQAERRRPCPLFDTAWYVRQYQGEEGLEENPLLHYLSRGASRGLKPNPYFDSAWYLEKYKDVAQNGMNPLQHYISYGAREGRNPSPEFNTRDYQDAHPGLAQWGMNPLQHYMESRESLPSHRNNTIGISSLDTYESWRESNTPTRTRFLALENALGCLNPFPVDGDEVQLIHSFIKAIKDCEYVSFDLFDTLLERNVARPTDIFTLVGSQAGLAGISAERFAEDRKQAEGNARSKSEKDEISHAEIYTELSRINRKTGKFAGKLKQLEISLEKKYMAPKAVGLKLLSLTHKLEKKILIISDTYLEKQVIADMVKDCIPEMDYALYVSSDSGNTKHTGKLFAQILVEHDLTPDAMIHVGDNEHSDRTVPEEMGIKTYKINRSHDAFIGHPYYGKTWKKYFIDRKKSLGQSLCTAIIANRLFAMNRRNCLELKDAYLSPYNIGYTLLGPLLLGFSQFLVRTAREQKYSKLFFISRDGYYMKVAYDIIRSYAPGLPESAYLFSSRRLLYSSTMSDLDSVLEVADRDYHDTTLGNFLKNRFNLDPDKNRKYLRKRIRKAGFGSLDSGISRYRNHDKLIDLLKSLQRMVIQQNRDVSTEYTGYLESLGITDGAAFVDIGYCGTIQKAVRRLIGVKAGGIYLITWDAVRKLEGLGLHQDAYLGDAVSSGHLFNRYIQLFELFFSATHPSVIAVEKREGGYDPVYDDVALPGYTGVVFSALHKGAIDFVRQYTELNHQVMFKSEANLEPGMVVEPLYHFFQNPHPDDALLFGGISFEDKFGFEKRDLISTRKKSGDLPFNTNESCWLEGSNAMLHAGEHTPWSHVKIGRLLDQQKISSESSGGTNITSILVDSAENGVVRPSYLQDVFEVFNPFL